MSSSLSVDFFAHILEQLPVNNVGDSSSINILINCRKANSALREAASIPFIWKPHYFAQYTVAVPEREAERRELHGNDWRLIFYERRRLDNKARKLLADIVACHSNRESRTKDLCRLSFDVWNVLENETRRPLPEIFRDPGDVTVQESTASPGPHALTRRFWGQNMLGVIARHHTLCLWAKLNAQGPDADVTFEEALAGLSAFFDHSPRAILVQLDVISAQCKEYLIATGHSLSDIDSDRLASICTSICLFLRLKGFVGAAEENFHDIFHHFPHRFLTSHKNTIPLSLVYVFVAVARRLGIAASPTNFPRRTIVHVSSPNPDVSDIYVDVFGSDIQAILSIRDDIPQLLLSAGLTPVSMMDHITPTTAALMLLRSSRNIATSLQLATDDVREQDCVATMYVFYCVNVLLSERNTFELESLSNFPLDYGLLRHTLAPLLQVNRRRHLLRSCDTALAAEKEAAKKIKQRSGTSEQVKYFTGLVFEHARHGYLGCIMGWDPVCVATEDWILKMGIDSLARGRQQPFYDTFAVAETSAKTYVAEENIRPVKLTGEIVRRLLDTIPLLGRYFEGTEIHENGWGRLLLSPECRLSYPDDDGVGNEWVLAKVKEGKFL